MMSGPGVLYWYIILCTTAAIIAVVVIVVSHIERIGCQPQKTTSHGGQSRVIRAYRILQYMTKVSWFGRSHTLLVVRQTGTFHEISM